MTAKITASADGLSGSLAVGANEAFQFKPVAGGLELSQDGITFQTVDTNGKVAFPQNPAVSGSGPIFSAWKSAATTLPSGSGTETPYETETADSANCYNPTTGRFTPNVAGWYLFTATGNPKGASTSSSGGVQLRKNGTDVFAITLISGSLSGSGGTLINVSGLVYLNGSTDYVSVFQYVTGTGALSAASGAGNVFSGTLVRGA